MARGRGLAGARRRLDEIESDSAAAGANGSDASPPEAVDEDFYDDQADADDPAGDDFDEDVPADTAPNGGRRPSRNSRNSRIFQAVMAALLVLAVGFGVGIWVGSPKYPGDDSADAGWARDMMTHHAQAVDMASLEFRTTSNEALKTLAVDITLTQQAQIGIMTAWLDTWGLSPTSSKAPMAWMPDGGKALIVDGRMPGMASDAQLAKLQSDTGKARDILFCQLMIQHHLGGIHMVDAVLPLAKNPQVKQLANQIKVSQQSEIDALQKLESGLASTN